MTRLEQRWRELRVPTANLEDLHGLFWKRAEQIEDQTFLDLEQVAADRSGKARRIAWARRLDVGRAGIMCRLPATPGAREPQPDLAIAEPRKPDPPAEGSRLTVEAGEHPGQAGCGVPGIEGALENEAKAPDPARLEGQWKRVGARQHDHTPRGRPIECTRSRQADGAAPVVTEEQATARLRGERGVDQPTARAPPLPEPPGQDGNPTSPDDRLQGRSERARLVDRRVREQG